MIRTVTSSNATGPGSLKLVLSQAQDGDTIVFAPNVTNITLTSTLIITKNVTIEGHSGGGAGAPGVTINGNAQFTDFQVNAGEKVAIDGLNITNGSGTGAFGGFVNTAPAPQGGSAAGGILDLGTLSLTNSTVTGNTAKGGGGGYESGGIRGIGGGAGGSAAGGIYVAYNATLAKNATDAFSGNTAAGGSGFSGDPGSSGSGSNGGSGGSSGQPGGNGTGSYGGGGGQPGYNGQDGYTDQNGLVGGGGGGGGGNAFNDFGGRGTVTNNAVAPVCFAAGTLISTARGEVAVEDLAVGDLAVTASGRARPIKWLGHRTIDCRMQPDPRVVWPIRVSAHAFGEDLPAADLFLSAGHAVKVDAMVDVLIPIGRLLNGATIARHPVDEVTYWHVELDSHDILIANGLPAESFLDCGNRNSLLEQAGNYDPDEAPHTPADFCLPFVDRGPILDAVRTMVSARATQIGWATTHDMGIHLMVDGARIDPTIDGTIARFFFPASARNVALASLTRTPGDAGLIADYRRLGISLLRLDISDGLRVNREINATDERLADLVHREADAGVHHRFTDGHLALPPSLWSDCRDQVVLRVHHDPASDPIWQTPANTAANVVSLRGVG